MRHNIWAAKRQKIQNTSQSCCTDARQCDVSSALLGGRVHARFAGSRGRFSRANGNEIAYETSSGGRCGRFFSDATTGVLVEVGAAHPDYLSVSASYRELGWKVIAVEPNPEFCELHRARGHEILQYACGDHDEDGVDFSVVDSGGKPYRGGNVSYESFSSLAIKESYAELVDSELDVRRIKVDLRRLDTLLEERASLVSHIDILAVDVEGWECEVLNGLNFEKFKPTVLIIENVFDDDRYREYMRAKGYELWRYIDPNDVYVASSELRVGDKVKRTVPRLATRSRRSRTSLRARLSGGR
jgi:FkbM family methyltransferase